MSKIYLIALEINLEKYLSNIEGNRKAAIIEGALGALGIKRKYRKLKVERLMSSWSILRDILTRNDSSFSAETFYATLLPDSLHIKGGSASVINNSFVFSALNGRKNEFERFLPAPLSSEQRDRAADMVSNLGPDDKIEIGVMAFFYDSSSEISELLLANRKTIGLPGGEIHIFEYSDDRYVYPSFIDIDTGKMDGFFAGNINSRMEMGNIRSNVVSLSEKFLIAHRASTFAPIDKINEWLPAAKPKVVEKKLSQKAATSSPSANKAKTKSKKSSQGMKFEINVMYRNGDTSESDERSVTFYVNDSKTEFLVAVLDGRVTEETLDQLFKHLYDNPNMNGTDVGVAYEEIWKQLSYWGFEKLGWGDVMVDVIGLTIDGKKYPINFDMIDYNSWSLQLTRDGYMYCYA